MKIVRANQVPNRIDGVYGTKGVAASGNVPGARSGSVSWIDASDNLWFFGGYGCAASGSMGSLNDLWKFDGTNWIWVSGSNTKSQYGVYGTKGVPAPDNVPGIRFYSVSWTDPSGNFWLFGGPGNAASSNGYLNDLWKFDGTNWTWVSGSNSINQAGVYGTKGVPASGNVPGNRYLPLSWTDVSGTLWLFGGGCYVGSVHGNLNDLWKFGIPETAADITRDGIVNGGDLMILAEQWADNASGSVSADIYPQPAGDGIVDFQDFAVFAQHWLDEI